ncbi:MAG: lasso RiPP family leader peptide-containing protein [Pseudonocardiaceae bacterium]|nr:lasso RiPP family leader peptide-containing protein [Pseudonocardiaceae bacterium]
MRQPYEAPEITLLGSVTELTQQDSFALSFDGALFRGDDPDPSYS